MEGRDMGTACATETTRWNPTKEQINMLESFYRQGIRTPSADQIHQITTRLQAYGNIQGKNVFYWFQNHKARQRQKYKSHNLPPPSAPNVVCGSYFLPDGDIGIYPQIQCPEVLGVEKTWMPSFDGGAASDLVHRDYNKMLPDVENHEGVLNHDDHHETLALFPLHPTGVLERRETLMSPFDSTSCVGNSTITPSSCETSAAIDSYCSGTGGGQHLFDFFSSCHGSS